MMNIIEKSFNNTLSTFVDILLFILFLILFIAWIYLPFAIFSMKRELKRIRELLEEKLDLTNKKSQL